METISQTSAALCTPRKRGVRERSKKEREERIILAARELFADCGYESATLRQIAARAGLGLATLFNYVSDKRDLIYLVFNGEMDALVDKALAAPCHWQSFEAKVLSITELHYRRFAEDPVLSRILLSEVLLQTPGLHLARFLDIRQRLIEGIERLVEEAQKTGEVQAHESAEMIARYIFFSFSMAVRWWLATPEPRWQSGQIEFQRILNLKMDGLRAGVKTSKS